MQVLPQLAVGLALVVLGGLFHHLWGRYRTRMSVLRWSADYQRLAVAASDANFGTVKVLYNEAPVQNLHFATVQLQNDSNTDIENLAVNLACLEGSEFLVSHGFVQGSLQSLPFTDAYWNALTRVGELLPNEVGYMLTHRDYRIPVLNRGGIATFGLLLQRRSDTLTPQIALSCDHVGVRVKHQPPAKLFWGVRHSTAVVCGVVVTLAGVVALAAVRLHPWFLALAAWFLGAFLLAPGALLIKARRWIGRLLS